MGVNNGSAWMQVKNIQRDLFHDGYDPMATTVSHYYIMLLWKGFGIKGLLNPLNIYYICRLLGLSLQGMIGEMIYKFQHKEIPDNTEITKMRKEFEDYQYQPKLQAW